MFFRPSKRTPHKNPAGHHSVRQEPAQRREKGTESRQSVVDGGRIALNHLLNRVGVGSSSNPTICIKGGAAICLLLSIPIQKASVTSSEQESLWIPIIEFDAHRTNPNAFCNLLSGRKLKSSSSSRSYVFDDYVDEKDGSCATFYYKPAGKHKNEVDPSRSVLFTVNFTLAHTALKYLDTSNGILNLDEITFSLSGSNPPTFVYKPPLLLIDLMFQLNPQRLIRHASIEALHVIVLLVTFGFRPAFSHSSGNNSDIQKYSSKEATLALFSQIRRNKMIELGQRARAIAEADRMGVGLVDMILEEHKDGQKYNTEFFLDREIIVDAFEDLDWMFNDWAAQCPSAEHGHSFASSDTSSPYDSAIYESDEEDALPPRHPNQSVNHPPFSPQPRYYVVHRAPEMASTHHRPPSPPRPRQHHVSLSRSKFLTVEVRPEGSSSERGKRRR